MALYRKTQILKTLIILPLSAFIATAGAQTEDQQLVLPQTSKHPAPTYMDPTREAIVPLRFTVKADGSIDNVQVLEGYSSPEFDEAAINTVQGWTFTPASYEGEAIDYHNQRYTLAFAHSEEPGMSPQVREAYEELSSRLEKGENEAAAAHLEALLQGDLSMLDYVFLNDVLSTIYMRMERPFHALAASQKATVAVGPQGDSGQALGLLPPQLLEDALRKRFLLASAVSQNVEALNTYERLKREFELEADDPIHGNAARLQEAVDSPEPLGQLVQITDSTWTYTPRRRTFAVTEVEGNIERIEVYCQRRNAQLEFQEDVEWTLPAAFGACELDFIGDKGSTFALYEFAPE